MDCLCNSCESDNDCRYRSNAKYKKEIHKLEKENEHLKKEVSRIGKLYGKAIEDFKKTLNQHPTKSQLQGVIDSIDKWAQKEKPHGSFFYYVPAYQDGYRVAQKRCRDLLDRLKGE